MKILIISNMYPSKKNPSYGIFVKNICDILQKEHEIKIIAIKKCSSKFCKVLFYIWFTLKSVFYGIFGKYDCIYAHYLSHCALQVAIIKFFNNKIIVIGNAHGEDIFSEYKEFEKNFKYTKVFLKKANYVIVPSLYFKKIVIEKYQYENKKIYVFPSGGINFNVFFPDDKYSCQIKKQLDTEKKYIGFISRIEKGKGWDTLLKAFKIIKDKGIKDWNYKLLIIGDGIEKQQLLDQIQFYGIKKDVILRPMVSQNELHYYYNSLDVFCFPTRRGAESLGLVGLEAMACGIPCVISDAGGPLSYGIDNYNCSIFKMHSEVDLAEKIIQLIQMSGANRTQRIKNGLNTAKQYESTLVEYNFLNFWKEI